MTRDEASRAGIVMPFHGNLVCHGCGKELKEHAVYFDGDPPDAEYGIFTVPFQGVVCR